MTTAALRTPARPAAPQSPAAACGGSCVACGSPHRRLTRAAHPADVFRLVLLGNRVALGACRTCGALWCLSRQGQPRAAPWGVAWPHTAADWTRIYDLDDGETLCHWHRASLRRLAAAGDATPITEATAAEWKALTGPPAPADDEAYARVGQITLRLRLGE